MSLIHWKNPHDVSALHRQMDDFFSSFLKPFPEGATDLFKNPSWVPKADFIEETNSYVLLMDLPGIAPKDVKVTSKNNTLIIEGERKNAFESKEKNVHLIERSYGKFYRAFPLPEDVNSNQIHAKFTSGQLRIEIPKDEVKQQKERTIEIH